MNRLSPQAWKGIAVSLAGWLTVALVIWVVGSVTTAAKTTEGETATANLLAARDAMAAYRRENGSYKGVTTARLRKLDPQVPTELDEPVTFGDIYAISLTTPSGVTYRLGMGTGGRETRDCSVPPGIAPGECELATQTATTGTW